MKKALYTGSFDPVTNGHLDIIRRASKLFDELTVGVIVNPNKNFLFSLDERFNLLEEAVKDLGNVRVAEFSGLLADFVNEGAYSAVVRGLRGASDFDYECQMERMNGRLFREGTETVFLMAGSDYTFLSSSMVKEVFSLGGDIRGLVPRNVLNAMKKKYK